MNFGDRLRQLRNERKLTQPELAEKMGIEQSYLSKLENGRSLPSNDTFQSILDAFGAEVGDLVDDLDQGVRNQLRQIPVVADHFNRQKQLLIGNRRRWLLLSAALVALGSGLFYAGSVHLFFPNVVYYYKSDGVVLEGESKEVFRDPPIPHGVDVRRRAEILNEMLERTNEDYVRRYSFAGAMFNIPVDDGSRTYYLQNKTEIDPWQNKAIAFIGVFMFVFGIIGLVLEKKLSRYQ